jgi:uncharacterized protein
MQCPSAPISPRSGGGSESMVFGPGWQPLWGEESCNDVEQRAGAVSPSRGRRVTRAQAAPSRRLRPRVSPGAPQRRPASGAAVGSERPDLDAPWVRGIEARGQRGSAQSSEAAVAGDRAVEWAEGRIRPRGVGAAGGGDRRLPSPEGRDSAAVATRSPYRRRGISARLLLTAIRVYQWLVSPRLGNVCRYEPSCSHYAYEAIERHGALKGAGLSLRRLGRCRPFSGRGYDPVPE